MTFGETNNIKSIKSNLSGISARFPFMKWRFLKSNFLGRPVETFKMN